MTDNSDDASDGSEPAGAAGPWKEGEPAKRGRYLIEYEEHGQKRVFVADYSMTRTGDGIELKWTALMDTATVLRYAPIYSPYTQYHE
jgi:hypothetical protein